MQNPTQPFYWIMATVVHIRKDDNGYTWRSVQQVPSFALPRNLHGLSTPTDAERFAHRMLRDLCPNAGEVHVSAALAE